MGDALCSKAWGADILSGHETGIHAFMHEQLRMRALLHHVALMQHDNQIGVAYGGEPMRDQ